MLAVAAHVILAGALLAEDSSVKRIGPNHWERISSGAFELLALSPTAT